MIDRYNTLITASLGPERDPVKIFNDLAIVQIKYE